MHGGKSLHQLRRVLIVDVNLLQAQQERFSSYWIIIILSKVSQVIKQTNLFGHPLDLGFVSEANGVKTCNPTIKGKLLQIVVMQDLIIFFTNYPLKKGRKG